MSFYSKHSHNAVVTFQSVNFDLAGHDYYWCISLGQLTIIARASSLMDHLDGLIFVACSRGTVIVWGKLCIVESSSETIL